MVLTVALHLFYVTSINTFLQAKAFSLMKEVFKKQDFSLIKKVYHKDFQKIFPSSREFSTSQTFSRRKDFSLIKKVFYKPTFSYKHRFSYNHGNFPEAKYFPTILRTLGKIS